MTTNTQELIYSAKWKLQEELNTLEDLEKQECKLQLELANVAINVLKLRETVQGLEDQLEEETKTEKLVDSVMNASYFDLKNVTND